MEWLSDPQAWAALATLTALEIVLGIDNIIFISILVGRLPARPRHKARRRAVASFAGVLIQIAVIDIVFSLDSVITAVGLVEQVAVMALAIVMAVLVMMFAARAISDFVDNHPTIKMLALSFP